MGGSGTSGTITVSGVQPAGCRWTASSATSWITLSFGTSGVLGGTVGYTIGPNSSINQRAGSIVVSGTTFPVTQSGASCTTSLSPGSTTISAQGGTGTVTVLAPEGCAWNPAPNAPWITITSSTGTGNGFAGYSVAPNTSPVSRISTITIGTANFTITQSGFSCSYSLSPSSASLGVAGGAGTFTVNTGETCQWTATPNNPEWLTVTANSSGPGPKAVSYNVLPNPNASSRTGTISVGSATFTVTQSASCGITLSPSQTSVTYTATSGTIRVTTNLNSCEWAAASDSTWLTISGTASGVGSGEVRYSVAANTASTPRTGTIAIGNQVFVVTQLASNCSTTLSTYVVGVPAAGGPGRIDVVSNCAWTATTNVNWLNITSGASGATNGSVIYSVARNPEPNFRSAIITIGGVTATIRQDGTPPTGGCTLALSPASTGMGSAGGSGTVRVLTDDGCAWAATPAVTWIAITTGTSGTGNGDVAFTAAANPTPNQRSGTITIGGQTFTVIQEGTACTYSIAPRSADFPAAGGGGTIDVTSACNWSASSNRTWILITGGASGTGNGSVTYTVSANNSVQPRSGIVTAAGQTFNVTQNGVACTVTLSGKAASLPVQGGSGTFAVTGTSGCDWSATTDASWLKVTWAAAGGSGTVYYTGDPNAAPGARTAQINVAGQYFAVEQAFGPLVATGGVVNAASYTAPPVSPGLIVTVFGTVMGPATLATLQLTPDQTGITKELEGTRILFDDTPAPMVYTSAGQVSAVVPYSVAGKTSTVMTVEYKGVKSNAVQLPVAAAAPAIFTLNASGSGPGAILNQNNTVNSTANPAARNQVIQIFATGEGETTPEGVDGRLMPGNALARPKLPVTVRIGNIDAPVTYAGSAPGLVAGVIQINARIASNAPLGDAVPVVLTIGGVQSPAGVTLVIR
ncbi:MAG: hypothetical protein HY822_22220 [Acidobacteria bacterium]|nr:hypothetical protein [Acidobacteriota bacterium]